MLEYYETAKIPNLHFFFLPNLKRILSVFYNSSEHIVVDIKNYILLIPIEEWLRVRPQLIICLKSNHPIVLKIINDIIISVGCKYPEVFLLHSIKIWPRGIFFNFYYNFLFQAYITLSVCCQISQCFDTV